MAGKRPRGGPGVPVGAGGWVRASGRCPTPVFAPRAPPPPLCPPSPHELAPAAQEAGHAGLAGHAGVLFSALRVEARQDPAAQQKRLKAPGQTRSGAAHGPVPKGLLPRHRRGPSSEAAGASPGGQQGSPSPADPPGGVCPGPGAAPVPAVRVCCAATPPLPPLPAPSPAAAWTPRPTPAPEVRAPVPPARAEPLLPERPKRIRGLRCSRGSFRCSRGSFRPHRAAPHRAEPLVEDSFTTECQLGGRMGTRGAWRTSGSQSVGPDD